MNFRPLAMATAPVVKLPAKRVENDIAWVGRGENNAVSARLPVLRRVVFIFIHQITHAQENPRRYPVLFDDCKAVEVFAIIDQRALRSRFWFYQNSITVDV